MPKPKEQLHKFRSISSKYIVTEHNNSHTNYHKLFKNDNRQQQNKKYQFQSINLRNINIVNNQKIQNLSSKLYPELTQLDPQQEKKQSKKHSHDSIFDDYTSQRQLQNNLSMNNAQRQLDQRIKNRMVEKSKKMSRDQIKQSYLQAYRKFKTQHKLDNSFEKLELADYQPPEVSPKGVNFYSQLKHRPALLKFTQSRIEQRNIRCLQLKRKFDTASSSILKTWSARKRNKTDIQLNRQQKWAMDAYNQQIDNINKIQQKLKKIYLKYSRSKQTSNFQQIKKSKILLHQQKILQGLEQDDSKISIKNKQKLIQKFNRILSQYGKCSKKQLLASLAKSQRLVMCKDMNIKHHRVNSSILKSKQ